MSGVDPMRLCRLLLTMLGAEVEQVIVEALAQTGLTGLDRRVIAVNDAFGITATDQDVVANRDLAVEAVATTIATRIQKDNRADQLIQHDWRAVADILTRTRGTSPRILRIGVLLMSAVQYQLELAYALLSDLDLDPYEGYRLFEAAVLEVMLETGAGLDQITSDANLRRQVLTSLSLAHAQWMQFGYRVAQSLTMRIELEAHRDIVSGLVHQAIVSRWAEIQGV